MAKRKKPAPPAKVLALGVEPAELGQIREASLRHELATERLRRIAAELPGARSEATASAQALSAAKAAIRAKYELAPTDTIDLTTGAITRGEQQGG